MKLSLIIILFTVSCTSITNDRAIILPSDTSYIILNKDKVKVSQTIEKGNLLILIQSLRGSMPFTPDIKNELNQLTEKAFIEELEYRYLDSLDLETIDFELKTASNFKYALLISYYSNNAVNQAMLHTFLKSSTLNIYDLVPVFSPFIGAFNHFYSFTLEASLIDVKSRYIIKNYTATTHKVQRVKGGTRTTNKDTIYDSKVIKKTAQKLVANM